ncbi:MAG: hypothetical protein U1F98_11410 [Verrucomicrobiota bacterium]
MKIKMTVLALVMALTPQSRAAIHRALRPEEFDIVWTASPAEAIRAAATSRPGLVLLDVDHSAGAAGALADQFRSMHPGTPVVVLAAHPEADAAEPKDPGVAVLWKPFGAAVLADTAGALLRSTPNNPKAAAPDGSIAAAALFRQRLHERAHTPLALTSAGWQRWGLNE